MLKMTRLTLACAVGACVGFSADLAFAQDSAKFKPEGVSGPAINLAPPAPKVTVTAVRDDETEEITSLDVLFEGDKEPINVPCRSQIVTWPCPPDDPRVYMIKVNVYYKPILNKKTRNSPFPVSGGIWIVSVNPPPECKAKASLRIQTEFCVNIYRGLDENGERKKINASGDKAEDLKKFGPALTDLPLLDAGGFDSSRPFDGGRMWFDFPQLVKLPATKDGRAGHAEKDVVELKTFLKLIVDVECECPGGGIGDPRGPRVTSTLAQTTTLTITKGSKASASDSVVPTDPAAEEPPPMAGTDDTSDVVKREEETGGDKATENSTIKDRLLTTVIKDAANRLFSRLLTLAGYGRGRKR